MPQQAHANQPLPENRPSSPCQPSSPVAEDHRFGFSPPQPTEQTAAPTLHPVPTSISPPISRPVPTPTSRRAPTQISSPTQLAPPSLIPDVRDISESESDHEASALQPEIDEQSDDEDDHQAHALLRAAPAPLALTTAPEPPTVIQTINPSFEVDTVPEPPAVIQAIDPSFTVCMPRPMLIRLLRPLQEFGVDQSVLQSHYRRNSPPKAPTFTQPTAAPPTQPLPTPHPTRRPKRPRSKKSSSRTLESYPPMWQEVIVYAKCAFR